MKKLILPLILGLILPSGLCRAEIIEEIWNKYAPLAGEREAAPRNSAADSGREAAPHNAAPGKAIGDSGREAAQKLAPMPPGRLMGKLSPEREADFKAMWKYRMSTYELHYDNPEALARTAYGLALHSGDIDSSLKRETFVAGVLGFHYSTGQVCAFANDLFARKAGFVLDDGLLLGCLLADGIISVKDGIFVPTGKAGHILAAAPGKKRGFAQNLRHERLHVFWDEDAVFRNAAMESWRQMPAEEKARVREAFYRYAQKNEAQITEEWAIKNAETSEMKID